MRHPSCKICLKTTCLLKLKCRWVKRQPFKRPISLKPALNCTKRHRLRSMLSPRHSGDSLRTSLISTDSSPRALKTESLILLRNHPSNQNRSTAQPKRVSQLPLRNNQLRNRRRRRSQSRRPLRIISCHRLSLEILNRQRRQRLWAALTMIRISKLKSNKLIMPLPKVPPLRLLQVMTNSSSRRRLRLSQHKNRIKNRQKLTR